MANWMDDRVGAAERGENPTVLSRMRTGWAVIGDTQHLPGYSLLLYAGTADHLSDLSWAERAAFLFDLSLLGEAVARACGVDPGFRRINYEILGNSWGHLHGHVHARYDWEPVDYRRGPVWHYGAQRFAAEHHLGERHDALRNTLPAELRLITAKAYEDQGSSSQA